eukprot:scpid68990/ scgid10077/ UPF0364 protein C6orf211 homolog
MSLPRRCTGKDGSETFTFKTLTDRMPVILTKVIDQLSRSLNDLVAARGQDARAAVKDALSRLTKMKRDLVTDKELPAFEDDLPDAKLWGDAVRGMSGLTWHSAPWLYSECYMYRAIHSAIELSPALKGFDPFQVEKEAAFQSALPGMESVAQFLQTRLQVLDKTRENGDERDSSIAASLRHLILLSLWGNRVDLCLLSKAASNSADEVSSLQTVSQDQIAELQHMILACDLDQVIAHLQRARRENDQQQRRLDIILDNSGFELFTDLCLVHYLLASKSVDCVQLHCKVMPWFVSDSLQKDVFWTLDRLQEHPLAALSQLGTALREHIDQKRILVTDHVFYTLPYEFSKMTRVCPDLYTELQKSYLVILKGDLNYRKLVADRRWPHTTSFRTGLSGFEPSAVCTLRTLKAETVVGLPEGCAEKVAEQDENWLHNGKYGVVQLLASPDSA